MTGCTPSAAGGLCPQPPLPTAGSCRRPQQQQEGAVGKEVLEGERRIAEAPYLELCVNSKDATLYLPLGHLSTPRHRTQEADADGEGPKHEPASQEHTGKEIPGPDRAPDRHSQVWRSGPRCPSPTLSLLPAGLADVGLSCSSRSGGASHCTLASTL